jgi:hypothetical protein
MEAAAPTLTRKTAADTASHPTGCASLSPEESVRTVIMGRPCARWADPARPHSHRPHGPIVTVLRALGPTRADP